MFEFINYLKLIATLLITNSHFGDIWPVSAMASGGLLGNIVFFAVSGYLLFNIKDSFPKWFLKRFLRVYPAMAAFTLFAVVIGEYSLNSFADAVRLFVYPTNYIFLVWLVICYCIYYGIIYIYIFSVNKKENRTIEISMLVVFLAWIAAYILFCDKTVYSVDNVSEPFILFLYMESMLLGAFFRKHKGCFVKFRFTYLIAAVASFAAYLVSKIAVSRISALLNFQIVNQLVIFVTLFFTFVLFISLENCFKRVPKIINTVVRYISGITLQIYVVQFVIIAHFEKIIFPLNLLTVSVLIVVSASVLYYAESGVRKCIGKLRK